jgi:hypothetical protein
LTGLFRLAGSSKHFDRKRPLSRWRPDPPVLFEADEEGNLSLIERFQKVASRGLSVGYQGAKLIRLNKPEKLLQEFSVLVGARSAAVLQHAPRDRVCDPALGNPNHEHVDCLLPKVPLGSVQDGYVGGIGRNEIQQKPTESLVPKLKPGKKPLETPIGRVGLDLRLPRVGQLGKVRGRLHRERSCQASHQLHSSPVPTEPLGENARQLPHVGEHGVDWQQ